MVSPRADQESLKIILTKLNRLELRFNEINSRLSAIEYSVVSDAITSSPTSQSLENGICTSCDIPRPLFQKDSSPRHRAASTYRVSVDKLRRRFEIDNCSELDPRILEEEKANSPDNDVEGIINEDHDNRSSSADPSRSVSRLSLTPCETGPNRDVRDIPSLRYEDLMIRTEEISDSEPSSLSNRSSATGSFSETHQPPSTARTSFTHRSWAGSRRSSTTDAFSKMRGSLRRAGSLRYGEGPPAARNGGALVGMTQDMPVAAKTSYMSAEEQEDVLRVYQKAQKSAKACVAFGKRLMYRIGKRMVNLSAIEKA
ncbi:hypothetical protein CORC01_05032 [Colletotrichum orchidophilum]|uniref:Uncharacterized protein n=1 Tax=Colletotrichum orchidophilum TaxID=1209926 RepID=A0A1G4BE29_9PEZI|nr:uncharacterized protein CORC01_05032 [Colletotrichum orchidophilum]OHE99674.1 hypothetical protein CORC01_05032 [Colletotrichum orchidophilum]